MKSRCIKAVFVFAACLIIGIACTTTKSEVKLPTRPPDTVGTDCPDNIGPGADLRNCSLVNSYLRGVYLSGANLSGADLTGADLGGAILNNVNLSNANLHRANLGAAKMRKVNLSRANLTLSLLGGADLTDAKLDDAIWDYTTCPDGGNSDEKGGSCVENLLILPPDKQQSEIEVQEDVIKLLNIPWETEISDLRERLKLHNFKQDNYRRAYRPINNDLKLQWCNAWYYFVNGKFSALQFQYRSKKGHDALVDRLKEEFGEDFIYSTYAPPPNPYGISYIWNNENIFAFIRFWVPNEEGWAGIYYKPASHEKDFEFFEEIQSNPFGR